MHTEGLRRKVMGMKLAEIDELVPMRCNNTAVRKAARHLTRFYDASMAEANLRSTQYAILSLLRKRGPTTMTVLADLLTMDRATMGHNLRPLERDGLIAIATGQKDRREREVAITDLGQQREKLGRASWERAQARFEREFGADDALAMRRVMARIAAMDFDKG
jgi:DNA-binding MarR family transcriptional regulator